MNGLLQAHLLAERDGCTVEPIACPLASLHVAPDTARPACAAYAPYDDSERLCPHLHRLVEWDRAAKPLPLDILIARAQMQGKRQMRCAVVCAASKIAARPGVWA